MLDRPQVLTLTDAAATRIRELIDAREEPIIGLRISITASGCSGMSYKISYVLEEPEQDELVEDKGVKVFIDPATVMYMVGTEMDFVSDKMQSGFVFSNPNETGRCGCGKSFQA